ncbi:MAG: deoxyhypusine synthase family protein [Thermodesulfovibrionales bacterium]|nr:deoxyhypusine synthase family protein [Thermodesulfovibrionales bacterium]
MSYRPVNLKGLKTYSIKKRKSKVRKEFLATPYQKGAFFREFVRGLPDILQARALKELAETIVRSRKEGRPVVLGMGAHVIKVGLSPIINDLINKGIITAIATNGACVIHDFELSYAGHTSEDVHEEIKTGMFGMAEETGAFLNRAIKNGAKKGTGIGRAVGEFIEKKRFPYRELSIFRTAYLNGIPATVHVAIGTDIIHMHPSMDGAATGKASLLDFRLFTSVVSDLEGGVYINLGSAVIMPEVFLKALTIARNLGHRVENITTANMDFIQHYRSRENVLVRPTSLGGRYYAITGHHEIMFPLLAAMIIEEL